MAGKRKADTGPVQTENVKRSALGELTNAVRHMIHDDKKDAASKGGAVGTTKNKDVTLLKKSIQLNQKTRTSTNAAAPGLMVLNPVNGLVARPTKVMTRAASRASQSSVGSTSKQSKSQLTETKDDACKVLKPKNGNDGGEGGGGVGNNNNNKNHKNTAMTKERRASRRLSTEFDSNENEESHYMSALEDW